jgi:hypothetical protein
VTNILEFNARWESGQLSVDRSFKEVFELVMAGHIVILHDVFAAGKLAALREKVCEWGRQIETSPPQTYIDENFHSVECGVSPRQKTPHNYHAYNFNQIHDLPDELSNSLLEVFEPLRVFQNTLTGNEADYHRNFQGQKLHPQIIQYPSGGGMFGKHVHPLEPQRIGLVLGMSERGHDFHSGATHFEIDGKDVGTESVHNIGDMILFRFDVPHWITEVDPADDIDYSSTKGRWTLVLPYY